MTKRVGRVPPSAIASPSVWSRGRDAIDRVARESPARLTLAVFAGIILLFTGLLQLPAATVSGHRAPFIDSLFTATSAVCVTGLVTVDTASFWSPLGKGIICIAMMGGGLGIMTLASILGMAVSRHIGLTQRLLAASETKSRLGEVGSLVRAVVVVALSAQAVLFLVLIPFFLQRGDALLNALGHSLFMAASIFNNAGFVIMPEGLTPYVGNWALTLPIILGTFTGAIGFPVILDMWRNRTAPHRWNLTTRITLVTYFSLFVLGAIALGACEWSNPQTLGALSIPDRLNAALLHSADARSSGLATLDVGNMTETSWFLIDALMFVGGGSASAAGGIKVTTVGVLLLAIIAEAHGDRDTEAFGKRLPTDVLRLGIAVTFVGALMVLLGTIFLLQVTDLPLSQVLFEVISAFATCGLSTGITPLLPASAKWMLVILMYAGRTGTMTLAAALALRSRQRLIRLPEERPVIG
ncbi:MULTISPECIES: potassium transporter TrkG [unclassified Actinobaculum]|uniref:TrkH family potassium uptake protein n=1 Tax=unclassified Actinobaculum TaxID=2609299 RepID=UPI001F0B7C76|nr:MULTISPECIES: potassium transporter TrkG [unclassified Actinobaculum]